MRYRFRINGVLQAGQGEEPTDEAPAVHGEYKVPIHMESMAIPPDEVAEHRRRYPWIDITNDGTPIATNRAQKLRYLKSQGYVESGTCNWV
ncbi:MAG: hypothetical protein IMZ50_10820 [Candidatus Atribacteria bacterium]|nr:hypothetical protein [Candidatus Atribacteria bacterium]